MSLFQRVAERLAEGPASLRTIQEASEAAEETLRTSREAEAGSLAGNPKPFKVDKFGPKLGKATKVLTPEEAQVISDFNAAIDTIDSGVQGLKVKLPTGETSLEGWWETTKDYMNQKNWKEAEDNIYGMLNAVPDFQARGYHNTEFARSLQKVLKDIKRP